MRPYLRYPGAKWSRVRWILSFLPPTSAYTCYIEPFAGSAACFFSLRSVPEQVVLNDLSGDLVNLFRMLRERPEELAALVALTPWARGEYEQSFVHSGEPLEDARRFLVSCWQAHGPRLHSRSGWSRAGRASPLLLSRWWQLPDRVAAVAERLCWAQIECRSAFDLLTDVNYWHHKVLCYIDPPYVLSTRHERYYQHELDAAGHATLLELLDAHPGMVVLSGYQSALYDTRLADWGRVSTPSWTEGGHRRQEVLWLNQAALSALAHRQLSLFPDTEEEDSEKEE